MFCSRVQIIYVPFNLVNNLHSILKFTMSHGALHAVYTSARSLHTFTVDLVFPHSPVYFVFRKFNLVVEMPAQLLALKLPRNLVNFISCVCSLYK